MTFLPVLFYFSIISFTRSQQIPSLRIEPELTYLWLLDGTALKLDCIYARQSSTPDESIDFYLNGQIISVDNNFGFTLSTTKQENVGSVTSTLTLVKNSASHTDGGEYDCKTASGFLGSRINVHIFKVTLKGDNLYKTKSTLNLLCEPEGINPSTLVEIRWSRKNSSIATSDKYNLHGDFTNSSLQILNPERSDMGEYDCEISFNPGTVEKQRIASQTVGVLAAPAIDQHSEDKIFAAGRNLILFCKASGYPLPNITWVTQYGVVISNSTRFQLMEYDGSPTGQLNIFSIETKDKGSYACKAWTEALPNSRATAVIRVQDAAPLSIDITVKNGVTQGMLWTEIRCNASGFPRPTVTWSKNGAPVKSSDDSRVTVYGSFLFGRLTIWPLLPDDDEGEYKCYAESPASPTNRPSKTAVILSGAVVVKDNTSKSSGYNLYMSYTLTMLIAVFTAGVVSFNVF